MHDLGRSSSMASTETLPASLSAAIGLLIEAIDKRDYKSLDTYLATVITEVSHHRARNEGIKLAGSDVCALVQAWDGLMSEFIAFSTNAAAVAYTKNDDELQA